MTRSAQEGEAGIVVSEETTDEPLRGPKYLNLKYDEDFSYLDGHGGGHQEDFSGPIEWIHITDDLTLTLGGELLARSERGNEPGLLLDGTGSGHDLPASPSPACRLAIPQAGSRLRGGHEPSPGSPRRKAAQGDSAMAF